MEHLSEWGRIQPSADYPRPPVRNTHACARLRGQECPRYGGAKDWKPEQGPFPKIAIPIPQRDRDEDACRRWNSHRQAVGWE